MAKDKRLERNDDIERALVYAYSMEYIGALEALTAYCKTHKASYQIKVGGTYHSRIKWEDMP